MQDGATSFELDLEEYHPQDLIDAFEGYFEGTPELRDEFQFVTRSDGEVVTHTLAVVGISRLVEAPRSRAPTSKEVLSHQS